MIRTSSFFIPTAPTNELSLALYYAPVGPEVVNSKNEHCGVIQRPCHLMRRAGQNVRCGTQAAQPGPTILHECAGMIEEWNSSNT